MIIVTGISSGIGKATVEFYLHKGEQIVGIGRSNSFTHPRFKFIKCDFSNLKEVSKLTFDFNTREKVTLINNAGIIGSINRISEQEISDIESVLTVNAIAPLLLTQKILQSLSLEVPIDIVNISSGAGRRPIASWTSYCASKAAMDMFSQTILLEEQERKRPIRVYSVAPGVVDTNMQENIRNANSSTFSSLGSFIDLKKNNELSSPKVVVQKLAHLLSLPYTNQVIYSLRDVNQ